MTVYYVVLPLLAFPMVNECPISCPRRFHNSSHIFQSSFSKKSARSTVSAKRPSSTVVFHRHPLLLSTGLAACQARCRHQLWLPSDFLLCVQPTGAHDFDFLDGRRSTDCCQCAWVSPVLPGRNPLLLAHSDHQGFLHPHPMIPAVSAAPGLSSLLVYIPILMGYIVQDILGKKHKERNIFWDLACQMTFFYPLAAWEVDLIYTFKPEIMSFGILRALHPDMLVFRTIKSRAFVMFEGDQWWMLLVLCLEFCTTHFYPSVVNFHNEILGYGCIFVYYSRDSSESEVAQSCPTLRDPMDCSLPGSSVHGIFQARVLEWGAIAFSRGHFKLVNHDRPF